MNIRRKLVTTELPESQPGFLGNGHMARPVVMSQYQQSDPFILLMDDMINKKDYLPAGGPHPHAGFETATLVLEGELGSDAKHKMKAGDFQIMTAGSGIEHTEVMDKPGSIRILQLWLNLPKDQRFTSPRVQDIPLEHVPVADKDGVYIRLYSGALAGIISPVQNHVPVIIADISLQPGTTTTLQLPANFNTFLYVLDGAIQAGEDSAMLEENQKGWLDLYKEDQPSDLLLKSGPAGARFVLYGGKPTGDQIISHGPFIGDTEDDIRNWYRQYRMGQLTHVNDLPEAQKFVY